MDTSYKIVPVNELAPVLEKWDDIGFRVVFTNGCFDILHPGHVEYLEKSRALADKLVVGLNTDASVKRLKGESRPINNEVDRARVMAGLASVDLVVLFDEDTPLELIKLIKPDILTKGADYAIKNIVGADFVMSYGGEVIPVQLVPGHSTTGVINKINAPE